MMVKDEVQNVFSVTGLESCVNVCCEHYNLPTPPHLTTVGEMM